VRSAVQSSRAQEPELPDSLLPARSTRSVAFDGLAGQPQLVVSFASPQPPGPQNWHWTSLKGRGNQGGDWRHLGCIGPPAGLARRGAGSPGRAFRRPRSSGTGRRPRQAGSPVPRRRAAWPPSGPCRRSPDRRLAAALLPPAAPRRHSRLTAVPAPGHRRARPGACSPGTRCRPATAGSWTGRVGCRLTRAPLSRSRPQPGLLCRARALAAGPSR